MFKKIIRFSIFLIMSFSLSACNIDVGGGLRQKIAELENENVLLSERLVELENENKVLADQIYELEFGLYKITIKAKLEEYAIAKGQINYSVENWAMIIRFVAEGKAEIASAIDKAGVNFVLSVATEKIDTVYREDEFVLKVFVEETTMPYGENFKVDVELINLSGKDCNIYSYHYFQPHILNWRYPYIMTGPYPNHQFHPRFFEKNGTLRNMGLDFGYYEKGGPLFLGGIVRGVDEPECVLAPGKHELRFSFEFFWNWADYGNVDLVDYNHPDNHGGTVWSNTIVLTVLEK